MLAAAKRRVKAMLLRRRHPGLTVDAGVTAYDCSFGRSVQLHEDAQLWRSQIGDYSYVGPGSIVADARVGRFCSIAPGVILGSGSHPARVSVSSHPAFYLARPTIGWNFVAEDQSSEFAPTVVGNDVWIGARAIVRDGVTIGDGAIVGAGAVVVRDVEPYTIVGGVPAKTIRRRFADKDIAFLLALRWWDKDEAWLRDNAAAFHDVDALRATVP